MATTNLGLKNDHGAGSPLASALANSFSDYLEALFFGVGSITHDDAATYTPAAATTRYPFLVIGGTLTAARNLVLPTVSGANWRVYNNTGQTLTVKTAAGTGIDVPTGTQTHLRCDGTDILRAGPQILTGTTTWDPGSIADGDDLSTTVTVTGAAVGDPAFAGLTTLTTEDVLISAKVSAPNTVEVTLLNRNGGAVDLSSGTLKAAVLKGV
jgi:hypothetical protein